MERQKHDRFPEDNKSHHYLKNHSNDNHIIPHNTNKNIINNNNKKEIKVTKENNENNTIGTFWDNLMTLFKTTTENVNTPERLHIRENNSPQPRDNTPEQYCSCTKTHNRDYCDSIYELIQMTKNSSFDNKRSKDLYKSLLKVKDKSLDINGENITQIKKDLNRTYPSTSMFKKEKILTKLKNILRAFSNYDNRIKYIQGMNFIVGFFLYHCEEYVAFWLFVSLIEEYDLRNIFMEGFPGLKLHVKTIETILQKYYTHIWNDFNKIGVKVEIFMVEWLFSMFSSLIPLDIQIEFYKGFFSEGWVFFYKMCISAILGVKGNFWDADEIYIALKCGKNDENVKEDEIKEKWKKIITNAYTMKLDI